MTWVNYFLIVFVFLLAVAAVGGLSLMMLRIGISHGRLMERQERAERGKQERTRTTRQTVPSDVIKIGGER